MIAKKSKKGFCIPLCSLVAVLLAFTSCGPNEPAEEEGKSNTNGEVNTDGSTPGGSDSKPGTVASQEPVGGGTTAAGIDETTTYSGGELITGGSAGSSGSGSGSTISGGSTGGSGSSLPGNSTPSGVTSQTEMCLWGEQGIGKVSAGLGKVGAVQEEIPLVKVIHSSRTDATHGEVVDVVVIFSRHFTDNTYGTGSMGWSPKRGHTFNDLVKSDHTEILLNDKTGKTVLHAKIDFISADESAPSGYSSLGVRGGDGAVLVGSADMVVSHATSLDDNFNIFGYKLLENSPATDSLFTANPQYPNWNFFSAYRITVPKSIFGSAGFGKATMTYVHSSPAKSKEDTFQVFEKPCPEPSPRTPQDPLPQTDPFPVEDIG